jgi:hypothetical protein
MEELYRRGNLLIRPPELSGNPTGIHLAAKQKLGQGNYEFGLTKYFCSYFEEIFNMPQNLTTWGLRLYSSPPTEGVLRIHIALKNPSPSAGIEPSNLGVQ